MERYVISGNAPPSDPVMCVIVALEIGTEISGILIGTTFTTGTLEARLDAVKAHGLACVQMSMVCAGLPEMPDQIPPEVIEERHARLLALVNEIGARRYEALVGKQMQILVEGPSRTNAARMMGRTRCNRIVVFDGSERHRGQIMDVKILRAGLFTLYGDPAILED